MSRADTCVDVRLTRVSSRGSVPSTLASLLGRNVDEVSRVQSVQCCPILRREFRIGGTLDGG